MSLSMKWLIYMTYHSCLKPNTINYLVEKQRTAWWNSHNNYKTNGGKPGRLLPWCIKQIQSERATNSTKDVNVNQVKINDTFKQFYKNLYSSKYPSENDCFLDNLEYPHISEDSKRKLDCPRDTKRNLRGNWCLGGRQNSWTRCHSFCLTLLYLL